MRYETYDYETHVSTLLWNIEDDHTREDVTATLKSLFTRTANHHGFTVFGEIYINEMGHYNFEPGVLVLHMLAIVGKECGAPDG